MPTELSPSMLHDVLIASCFIAMIVGPCISTLKTNASDE